jgi:hypothetical protein
MPSPFPGMDPYLEHPDLWPDVHNGLIAALRDALAPVLRPRYYVALEERTYLDDPPELLLVGRPDLAVVAAAGAGPPGARERPREPRSVEVELPLAVPVRETYLEVRGVADADVVTVIELLSPANKRPGAGRRLYLDKRLSILATRTSLVELDLLRAGEPMPTRGPATPGEYRILVSRGWRRPRAELIPFGVRDPLPPCPVPLRQGEDEPTLALGAVVGALYDRAGYDLRIDYQRDPVPPLTGDDVSWAAGVVAGRGAPLPSPPPASTAS